MSPDGGNRPHTPDINQLIVDPQVESAAGQSRTGSGQEEVQFFVEGGEQYKLLHNRQSLGLLGKLWGSSSCAPTNIAGLLLLLCFTFGGLSFVITQSAELAEARKWLLGFTTTVVGFLFGTGTRAKSE